MRVSAMYGTDDIRGAGYGAGDEDLRENWDEENVFPIERLLKISTGFAAAEEDEGDIDLRKGSAGSCAVWGKAQNRGWNSTEEEVGCSRGW
jgi:hypothetical protein